MGDSKTFLRVVAALPVFACLVGCVPVLIRSSYGGEAAGGRAFSESRYAPKTKIEFVQGGVRTSTTIFRRAGGEWMFELRFSVPAGRVVEVREKTIHRRDEAGRERDVAFAGLSPTGNPALPVGPIGPMVGEMLLGGCARNFWLFAPLPRELGERLVIQAPAFTVNGQIITLPPIRFTKRTDVSIAAPIQY